ncbi:hypothetical protein BY996DRAFT_7524609 [Phakopsora pachyrhizi]|nr:hypothetical protein BY996DRAFT_7524609 [Phakopsora pachyrhizi]
MRNPLTGQRMKSHLQASNFEEALNPYHRDPWNSAPVDHSSFSGQIHQHQAYPQEGSSHDQGSSSNNVQHNYEGDVFRENNSNFVPHFNEFWYPDSSFEHHPHQNFEISHDEQMTQDPAFYSMLNDLSYSPHHYDVENRDYQKHEKINFVKYEGKSGLISTLKNEFSKHPLGTELEFMSHESWGVNVGHLTTKNAEWKEHTVIDYTLQIDWKGAEALKINIRSLANTYKNYGFLPKGRGGTVDHIENISIWGITFMKIIAKTYSNNPVSEFFGSHQSLYDYTERFWNFCFTTDGKTEELRNFFGSLGKECSQEDTGHFISTKFLNEYNTPGNIFSMIKQEITGHTEMQVTYMFSWYFVFFRAMFKSNSSI